MNIKEKQVKKLELTNLDGLDNISIFIEDFKPGHGQITIICYGKAWTSYWGAMGNNNICKFFCSCNEDYIAGNIAPKIKSRVYDIDQIRSDSEKKGIDCCRDDPWNDYDFINKLYGNYNLPMIKNHEYIYLCKIINTVKSAINC